MRSTKNTYINGHLVNMHPLFDTKFGYEDIEGSVKDTDHDSRANDWAITLSQVRNQNAQEKMGGLLLSKLRRFLLAIYRFVSTDYSHWSSIMKRTYYIVEQS